MAFLDNDEISKARSSIVTLLNQEYEKHSVVGLDPYEFGAAVAPLVNAMAALSLMEKERQQDPDLGAASRSDD